MLSMRYFESGHEKLDDFLHAVDFYGGEVGYGDLSVFALADLEAGVGVVVEIVYLFIVDLEERD